MRLSIGDGTIQLDHCVINTVDPALTRAELDLKAPGMLGTSLLITRKMHKHSSLAGEPLLSCSPSDQGETLIHAMIIGQYSILGDQHPGTSLQSLLCGNCNKSHRRIALALNRTMKCRRSSRRPCPNSTLGLIARKWINLIGMRSTDKF